MSKHATPWTTLHRLRDKMLAQTPRTGRHASPWTIGNVYPVTLNA